MNTKTLSPRASSVIDQYLHFKVGNAVCSVPYFNNKTVKARAALRAVIGKGSPKDIHDEVQAIIVKQHISADLLTDISLKKLLVDSGMGLDCSAFAYYVLNAENEERGLGKLEKHLSFVNCHGLVGKIRCSLRPVENCDVATLSDDRNSRTVDLKDAQPGDVITMVGDSEESERDHILVIHQVEYQNFAAVKIHYSHTVAYPEDGMYGSGVKQGEIELVGPTKPLIDQIWKEDGSQEGATRIFNRAKISKTELRRLQTF